MIRRRGALTPTPFQHSADGTGIAPTVRSKMEHAQLGNVGSLARTGIARCWKSRFGQTGPCDIRHRSNSMRIAQRVRCLYNDNGHDGALA